jgi:Tfp pilus assembly PilM family ATPase
LSHLIALDWDNREFHLVEASVGRGKAHVKRALQWREDEPIGPANAEAFGNRLRDRLKEAGIAPAPIVVGLGRDRMVVKEVRYPDVGAEVEAAIVRNQIIKELTESPEDVLIDYAPLAEAAKNGQRRALSLVVRKDIVQAIQKACQVAGLKLLAVTARPYGIATCFKHLAGTVPQVPAPPSPDSVSAVLTVAEGWAEFCAVRGDQLLMSRAVTTGEGLLNEVRRNLAAYAGQPQLSFPRDAIQALYVAGNGDNVALRETLRETLGIPVHGLDPLSADTHASVAGGTRAGYTGAVGLLYLWAKDEAAPANFVKPREVKQVVNPHKRRAIVYGILGSVAFVVLVVGGYLITEAKQADVDELRERKKELAGTLKGLQPEIKYVEALRDWTNGSISWLDELYDLVARVPPQTKDLKFRITQITMAPNTSLGTKVVQTSKDPRQKDKEQIVYTAQMILKIEVPRRDARIVDALINRINQDKHCKATGGTVSALNANDPAKASEVHTVIIDIAHQSPGAYREKIVRPGKRALDPRDDGGDDE